MALKKVLGKWQFIFHFGPSVSYLASQFSIGLIKLTSIPKEGSVISRRDHKGLVVTITFRMPQIWFRSWIILGRRVWVPYWISFRHLGWVKVW
jgi:hypothetical protein